MSRIELFGIKADGAEVFLGVAAKTPPEFKRREIVANYFSEPSGNPNDYDDANSCLLALEDYHNWLVEQGWIGPGLEIVRPEKEGSDSSVPGAVPSPT